MTDISEMDRNQLENYAQKLEQRNRTLLKILDRAKNHIEASTEIDRDLQEKIEEAIEKDKPDITHYSTDGVQEAMSELRETVEEQNEKMKDLKPDES